MAKKTAEKNVPTGMVSFALFNFVELHADISKIKIKNSTWKTCFPFWEDLF